MVYYITPHQLSKHSGLGIGPIIPLSRKDYSKLKELLTSGKTDEEILSKMNNIPDIKKHLIMLKAFLYNKNKIKKLKTAVRIG